METLRESRGRNSAPSRLQAANSILEALHGCINTEALPDFGSGMLHHSNDVVFATTVGHRVLKKFQRPSRGHKQALRQACFDQWVAYEEELSKFDFYSIPSEGRQHLYKARALIHEWCSSFRRNTDVVEFTPGETFVSAKGRVSVYQKLVNKDAWCVTHDACDDFIRLCYNNASLKRCAKAHWPKLGAKEYALLHAKFRNEPHVGYAVFRFMMEQHVITLVHGSRASSVPKNNSEDRFINVEPLGNMILQRQVALPLREILRSVGNDLEIGQEKHRLMIANPRKSTVDFSKASDSVLLELVKFLFPGSVSKLLCRYRSPMVLVGDCYYVPNKLSSMGCGFTFEVMSMILLATARVLDSDASVYGDDVIIETSHAERFVETTGHIYFRVNQKKTFVGTRFRESCGAFYLDDYGYIKCFDLHWLECDNDILIAVNKLYLIMREARIELKPHYREAYEALLRLVPALQIGYMHQPEQPDLGFAMSDGARRKHMRSQEVTSLRRRNQTIINLISEAYQVNASDILLCAKPKFVSHLATKTLSHLPDQRAKYASYLYGGRRSPDVIRNSGKWVTSLTLVHPEFCLGIQAAKALVQSWCGPLGLHWVPTRWQSDFLTAGL